MRTGPSHSGSQIATTLSARARDDRPAIVRSFVAKAVLTIPTTSALIERLQIDRALRRICGWERRSQGSQRGNLPRALLPSSPHKVCRNVCMSNSSAVICTITSSVKSRAMPRRLEAREKPRRRSSDDPPPPAPRKREAWASAQAKVLPPKPLTRIEQQAHAPLALETAVARGGMTISASRMPKCDRSATADDSERVRVGLVDGHAPTEHGQGNLESAARIG